MADRRSEMTLLYCMKVVGVTVFFNTGIAVFLTTIQFMHADFYHSLVFSQCIGLSICISMLLVYKVLPFGGYASRFFLSLVAMAVGLGGGSFLGARIVGTGTSFYSLRSGRLTEVLLVGVVFGTIITWFFLSRERLKETEARANEEKIQRLTMEKRMVATDLKRLQAQIEPHFLFNTLSNVLSLLDTAPGRGKQMLEDLICYLRTSLSKSRSETATLGEEMTLIQSYINIFRIRMGDRLQCSIRIPREMAELPFPPMMIQPLVENAIVHGLEPRVGGGEISIEGEFFNGGIRIEVKDTGNGMGPHPGQGTGLANIRERLAALYGDRGSLSLSDNRPNGVKAIIEVPCETT